MKDLMIALKLTLVMTLLTGLVYPLVITGVGDIVFRHQITGRMITSGGKTVGSALIGQRFTDPKYFWPRPSANDYTPLPSGGSNLGPTSSDLKDSILARRTRLAAYGSGDIPEDLLCASGSGLDPDISPEAAAYQVGRVASARQLDLAQRTVLLSAIDRCTKTPTLGVFGQPRVNVLRLNLSLDSLAEAIR